MCLPTIPTIPSTLHSLTLSSPSLPAGKSFWGKLLGGMNDYYYELAVQARAIRTPPPPPYQLSHIVSGLQAVDICLRARSKTGGLLKLSFVHEKLAEKRSKYSQEITCHDVEMAISALTVLGNGYKIIRVRGDPLVQSVPCELSDDHTVVLGLANGKGYITTKEIELALAWTDHRARTALGVLLREGMAWLDLQDKEAAGPVFYFPSMWPQFDGI